MKKASVASSKASAKAKGKRGRPKKRALDELDNEFDDDADEEGADDVKAEPGEGDDLYGDADGSVDKDDDETDGASVAGTSV